MSFNIEGPRINPAVQKGKTVLYTAANSEGSEQIRYDTRKNWQAVLRRPIDPSLLDTLAALNEQGVDGLLSQLPNKAFIIFAAKDKTRETSKLKVELGREIPSEIDLKTGRDVSNSPFTEPFVRALRIIREADNIQGIHPGPWAFSPGEEQTLVIDLEVDLLQLRLKFLKNPGLNVVRLFEDSRSVVKNYYS